MADKIDFTGFQDEPMPAARSPFRLHVDLSRQDRECLLSEIEQQQLAELADTWEGGLIEQWQDYWLSAGKFSHSTEYIATATRQEPVANGHPLGEPGDLWVEFGPTADEAVAALKASLV